MAETSRQILGITFHAGDLATLLERTASGGLIVVPSAPVLVDLARDPAHRAALEQSDFAITDSGFMVLLWRLFHRESLPRISGLKYLRALLAAADFRRPGATFWIMPSAEDAAANQAWLAAEGVPLPPENMYIAPQYPAGPLADPTLLARIESRQPRFILINLGGGVQERLGHFLRQNLNAFRVPGKPMSGCSDEPMIGADQQTIRTSDLPPLRSSDHPIISSSAHPSPPPPAIICTGAAIAFLSGRQASIPVWADRLMLGWLFRTLSDPARFLPRYWKALRLVPLLWRHGERSCG